MNKGADGKPCNCDGGWVVDHRTPGPIVNGEQTYREVVRRCRACNPEQAARIDAGLHRDDPAIERHRRNRDRVTGRDTDS